MLRKARQQIARVAIAIAALITFVTTIAAPAVKAQDATPAPVLCTVGPRPATFIVDLLAQPVPETTPEPLTGLPEGTDDIDADTRAATVAVIEELIACVNLGEVLRAFSLYDDAYLRRLIDPEGLMSENIAIELGKSFATPEPKVDDEITTLERVILIRRLPDASIAVVFETRGGVDRDEGDLQIDMFILREISGQWRIVDGLADLDSESIPVS